MKIRQVWAELLHADGQMGKRMKQLVSSLAFRNFANAPSNETHNLGAMNCKTNKFGVQHTWRFKSNKLGIQQTCCPTNFIHKSYVSRDKGKVIPLQSRCDPQGG